eukprot:g747.t1
MYVSGFKLNVAPTHAIQARRHQRDFQHINNNTRLKPTTTTTSTETFPQILTTNMKRVGIQNYISSNHRNRCDDSRRQEYVSIHRPGFSGKNISKIVNRSLQQRLQNKPNKIMPASHNITSMNNNKRGDIYDSGDTCNSLYTRYNNNLAENNNNYSNNSHNNNDYRPTKPQYFVDNNNQIHEKNVKKKLARKPRPSDILGIKRTNTAPEQQQGITERKDNKSLPSNIKGQRPTSTSAIITVPNNKKIKQNANMSAKRRLTERKKKQKEPVAVVQKIPPPLRMYYIIGKGNNSILLMKMFRARNGWSPVEIDNPKVNFIWTMYKKTSTFKMLKKCKEKNQILIINHFPGNNCLVTKKGLFHSLSKYHKAQGTDVGQSVPMTFHLIKGVQDEQYEQFVDRAEKLDQMCRKQEQDNKHTNDEIASSEEVVVPQMGNQKAKNSDNQKKKRKKPKKAKATKQKAKSRTGAYWIVKPASMTNRGYGIKVVASVDEVMKIVNGTATSTDNSNKTAMNEEQQNNNGVDDENDTKILKKTSRKEWIVQKYMENPLLYNQRKFDIRCFILVTGGDFSVNCEKPKQHLKCYLYTEGYLRTSSVKFSLDEKKLKNTLMHLTNDGIQNKDSKNYGKHEQGNKVSYEQFQKYLSNLYPNKPEYASAMEKRILPQIKNLIIETMEAVQDKIAGKTSTCFELYGYDFMVDSDLKVWLIEVNSNPCLEDWSCPLLGKMISNMLSCMMKIAVDKPLQREQHTHDFESKVVDIEDSDGAINLQMNSGSRRGNKGWEPPALSEAQIERRKRLQRRHDFECIWSQKKKTTRTAKNEKTATVE